MTLLRPSDRFPSLYMIMVRAADDHSVPVARSDAGTAIVVDGESSRCIAAHDKQPL